jgi:hypothetical protein
VPDFGGNLSEVNQRLLFVMLAAKQLALGDLFKETLVAQVKHPGRRKFFRFTVSMIELKIYCRSATNAFSTK